MWLDLTIYQPHIFVFWAHSPTDSLKDSMILWPWTGISVGATWSHCRSCTCPHKQRMRKTTPKIRPVSPTPPVPPLHMWPLLLLLHCFSFPAIHPSLAQQELDLVLVRASSQCSAYPPPCTTTTTKRCDRISMLHAREEGGGGGQGRWGHDIPAPQRN